MAVITAAMRSEVTKFYVAMFNRAPEAAGLDYWVTERSKGFSAVDVAQRMYDASINPTNPNPGPYSASDTPEEFVRLVYSYVLGRPSPDSEGVAYWTAQLTGLLNSANPAESTVARGVLVARMLDAVLSYVPGSNLANDAATLTSKQLLLNKVAVAEYYGYEYRGDIEHSGDVLVGITASSTAYDTDGELLSWITGKVQGADKPVAQALTVSTQEDSAVSSQVSATDPNGDTLVYNATGAVGGTVAMNQATGEFTFTPTANFNGAASFSYTVTDPSGLTDTKTVTVNVSSVNDAPVAADSAKSTNEDTAATGSVSASDTADNDTTFTYTVVSGPAHGTLTAFNPTTGAYTYTPNANFNGTDTFTFRADDGDGGSDTAVVTLTINPVNDAPVASDATVNGFEDTVLNGSVTASDVENNALTYTVVSGPAHGDLVLNADGTFTYTPDADYSGEDSFTYKVNDGSLDSNEATVTLNLTAQDEFLTPGQDSIFGTNEQDLVFASNNNLNAGDIVRGNGNVAGAGDVLVHFIDDSASHTNFAGFVLNGVEVLQVTADKTNQDSYLRMPFATLPSGEDNVDRDATVTESSSDVGSPIEATDEDYTNETWDDATYDLSSSSGLRVLRSLNSTQDVSFNYVNGYEGNVELPKLEALNLTDGVNVAIDYRNDVVTGEEDKMTVLVTDSDDDDADVHVLKIDDDVETIVLRAGALFGGDTEVRIGRIESFGDGVGSSTVNTLRIENPLDNEYLSSGQNNSADTVDLFIGDDDGNPIDGPLGWAVVPGSTDIVTGPAHDDIENSLDASIDLVDARGYLGNITLSTRATGDNNQGEYDGIPDTTILGGEGDDAFFAGSGDDYLAGNGGVDALIGGSGDDSMDGGAEDDYYIVSHGFEHGEDEVISDSGETGTDVLIFNSFESGDTLELQNGSGLEVVVISDVYGDTRGTHQINVDANLYRDSAALPGGSADGRDALVIIGNDGNNLIRGTSIWADQDAQYDANVNKINGDDTIKPNDGVDTVYARAGNDLVVGADNVTSADVLDGGDSWNDAVDVNGANTRRDYDDPANGNGDTLSLNGPGYSEGLIFGANFTNFERLVVNDANEDGNSDSLDGSTQYNYDITFGSDANAEAQNRYWINPSYVDLDNEVDFIVDARALTNGTAKLTFDATIEDDAEFWVFGGAGNDVIRTGNGGPGAGGDTVLAGAGNDSVMTYTGNDSVMGGAGNDTINGGAGNENLFGEAGVDLFQVEDDALTAGDRMDGGTQIDTLQFLAGDQHEDDADFTNVTNIEIVRLADGAGSTLHLGAEAENNVVGETGVDSVFGGTGSDVVDASSRTADLTGTQEDGATDASNAGYTTAIYIDGGSGNDKIAGGTAADVLIGGRGADSLWGNDGADQIWVETGHLTSQAAYNAEQSADSVDGGAGDDTVYSFGTEGSGEDNDLAGSVSGSIHDAPLFETPDATFGNHVGHTTTPMQDTLVGGSGFDTLVLSGDHRLLFANGSEEARMTGFEKIVVTGSGSDYTSGILRTFNDEYDLTFVDGNVASGDALVIDGSSLNNVYRSSEVRTEVDTLRVDAAAETDGAYSVVGGAGNDVLIGGNLADYVDDENGYQADTLKGGAGDDVIVGNAGKDYLEGGSGNDRFDITIEELRNGYDTIQGGENTDTINLLNSGVIRDLDFVIDPTYRVISGIENLQLAGGDDQAIIGLYAQDAGIREVLAGAGDDLVDARAYTQSLTIHGQSGNDTLIGGASNVTGDATNYLFGDEGDDVLMTDAVTGPVNNPDHHGYLEGGAGNDSLRGARNSDTLIGGEGDDTLDAGAGNDFLRGDSGSGDDLMLAGTGDDTVQANSGNDTVWADSGNDRIEVASSGDVVVYGEAGADTVIGDGSGTITKTDVLDGGSGVDVLVLDSRTGTESIVFNDNFTKFEKIVLTDGVLSSTLDTGVDYNITLDDTNVIGSETSVGGARSFVVDASGLQDDLSPYNSDSDSLFLNAANVHSAALSVTGGDFADVVWGGAAADTVNGGTGSDLIGGGAGADKLNGEAGNDTLYGGFGADLLTGGAGNDVYVFIGAPDSRALSLDTIAGYASGSDKVGLAFTHEFAGNVADFGLVENVFDLNKLDGKATVVYDQAARRIYIDRDDNGQLSNNDIVIQLDGTPNGSNELSAADFVEYTGGLVISGTTGADTLIGTSGNDTIVSLGGADSILAGSGDDVIDTGSGGNGDVTASIYGGSGNDSLVVHHDDDISAAYISSDVENLVVSESHIYLTAAQNEQFANTPGHAVIDGDATTPDRFTLMTNGTVTGSNAIEQYDLAAGGNLFNGTTSNYALGTGGQTVIGGSGADTINGGSGSDLINGDSGDDVITGGLGSDTMTGGSGNDTMNATNGDVVNADDGADVINALAGSVTVNGYSAGVDTLNVTSGCIVTLTLGTPGNDVVDLSGINNPGYGVVVDLAGGNDSLLGSTGADSINGGEGNDTIAGNGSNPWGDLLFGGSGDDVFVGFGNSADWVDGDSGTNTLVLTGTSTGLNTTGNDHLVNVQLVSASGAAAGTVIDLHLQAEAITITGSANADTITMAAGGGNADGGAGNDVINGSGVGDVINGGIGDDTINAGSGDDTLIGFDGIDSVNGGSGTDVLQLVGTSATLNTAGNGQVAGVEIVDARGVLSTSGVVIDLSNQTEGFSIYGSAYSDVIAGSVSGDDTISAGGGKDTIDGWQFIDTSTGWYGEDIVDGGADVDTLYFGGTSIDFNDLTSNGDLLNVELIVLDGAVSTDVVVNLFEQSEGFTVIGGLANDSVRGGSGSDTMWGAEGNDWLFGASGDDTLQGGLGNDTLDGGIGNDVLRLVDGGLDVAFGGSGDDLIVANSAAPSNNPLDWDGPPGVTVDGGTGNDTLSIYDMGDWNDWADNVTNVEVINWTDSNATGESLITVQGLVAAGATLTFNMSSDVGMTFNGLVENDGHFVINGSAGNDSVSAGALSDTVSGNAGNDWIWGAAGDDSLIGGAGSDTIWGGSGDDTIELGSDGARDYVGLDTAVAGDVDTIYGFEAADSVTSSTTEDVIVLPPYLGNTLNFVSLEGPFGELDLPTTFSSGDVVEIESSIGTVADLGATGHNGNVEALISLAINETGTLAAGQKFYVALYNDVATPDLSKAGIYEVTIDALGTDGDLSPNDFEVQLIGVVNVARDQLDADNFIAAAAPAVV